MILAPKIPSCGQLAQPQGKAGLVVAGSWPRVESGEVRMRRVGAGGLNRHTVRPQ